MARLRSPLGLPPPITRLYPLNNGDVNLDFDLAAALPSLEHRQRL